MNLMNLLYYTCFTWFLLPLLFPLLSLTSFFQLLSYVSTVMTLVFLLFPSVMEDYFLPLVFQLSFRLFLECFFYTSLLTENLFCIYLLVF